MKSYHHSILNALKNLRFNVGKTTLVSYVIGDLNPTIERNNLDEDEYFGCLHTLNKRHIYAIISELEKDKCISTTFTNSGLKTLKLTPKGRDELVLPTKEYSNSQKIEHIEIKHIEDTLKESDHSSIQSLLPQFSFFLDTLNEKQQIAVLNPNSQVLCVAGAGSGKTTVLIKRIEFLVRLRGTPQEEILAITFTTKARDEMKERLLEIGLQNVIVHTFNSFCEQELRRIENENSNLVSTSKVLTFSLKLQLIREILNEEHYQFEKIAREYFSSRQLKEKTPDELFLLFCYELFSILDYLKNTSQDISQFTQSVPSNIQRVAKYIETIILRVQEKMKELRLRDFTDQVLEVEKIYSTHASKIPQFSHILVDEYQDINAIQLRLIKHLTTQNIFCVGDPRQSIYNWRGSDISFILDFNNHFSNVSIVLLEINYRSTPSLITLANTIIKPLQLLDLKTPNKISEDENEQNNEKGSEDKNDIEIESGIEIIESSTQENEFLITLSYIKTELKKGTPANEIFVLARVNKVLEEFSKTLTLHGIAFNIKSDDFSTQKKEPLSKNQIILATIHAIKGQEAKHVFIIEAGVQYFPNKVQDNEYISYLKSLSSYDKYQEELRLFYVACTRAKEKLYILYTGTPTSFLPKDYIESNSTHSQKKLQHFLHSQVDNGVNSHSDINTINEKKNIERITRKIQNAPSTSSSTSSSLLLQLKQLRLEISSQLGIETQQVITNTQLQTLATTKPLHIEEVENILHPNSFISKKYAQRIINLFH